MKYFEIENINRPKSDNMSPFQSKNINGFKTKSINAETLIANFAVKIGDTNNTVASSITSDSTGIYITGYYTCNQLKIGNFILPNWGGSDSYIVKYSFNGEVIWATRIAGNSHDNGFSIISDNIGGIYIIGTYSSNSVNIYNANGNSSLTLSNEGKDDCFIVKYDVNGNALWANKITGNKFDDGYSITTDNTGLYITGYYNSDILKIYNSNGTLNSTLPNSGFNDCFVIKYDFNGNILWKTRIIGTSNESGYSISANNNEIYVTGSYASNNLLFYNANNTQYGLTLSNSGKKDIFVVKYDTNGNVGWITRIGGPSYEEGYSIASDNTGIYITGYYTDNLFVYNANGTQSNLSLINSGSNDCFIAKYDLNGNALWITRIAGDNIDTGNCIAIDKNNGGFYITGFFDGSSTNIYNSDNSISKTIVNPNIYRKVCFVVKYDINGKAILTTKILGEANGQSLLINNNDIYVVGNYQNNLTIYNSDDTISNLNLPGTGLSNCFIVKYTKQ